MTMLDEGYRADLAQGSLHDIDDAQHAVAVDFPHEVLDSYRTDWARGCWDASFAKRMPAMVFNHNPDLIIGGGMRGEALGDRTRVIGRFADFDAVPKARETYSLVSDGLIPGWSFHFRNGQTVAHPDVRGARRYVKADMLEFSPVTFPSIPGAQAVGLRAEEATMAIPTLSEILKLRDDGLTDDSGVRALIAEHYPNMVEHIRISSAPPVLDDAAVESELAGVRARLAEQFGDDAVRHLVISVDKGNPGAGGGDDGGDDDGDPADLASAVDAALDEAANLLDGTDVTELPDNVQQALALVQAAGVAIDELLEVMGVEDPDDGGRASRDVSTAPWDFDASKYTPEQLKAACLVVDGDGSTKDQCHLPVREPDGTLNANAVHAAAAALAGARGGTKLAPADKKAAAGKLISLYSKIGGKPPASLAEIAGDGRRSEDADELAEHLRQRFSVA